MVATSTSKPCARAASRASNGKRPLPATRPSLGLTTIKRGQWSGFSGQGSVVRVQWSGFSGQGSVVRVQWSVAMALPHQPFSKSPSSPLPLATATDHLLNHPTLRTLDELDHNVYVLSPVRL